MTETKKQKNNGNRLDMQSLSNAEVSVTPSLIETLGTISIFESIFKVTWIKFPWSLKFVSLLAAVLKVLTSSPQKPNPKFVPEFQVHS